MRISFLTEILPIPSMPFAPGATYRNLLVLGKPWPAFSGAARQLADTTIDDFSYFFNTHNMLLLTADDSFYEDNYSYQHDECSQNHAKNKSLKDRHDQRPSLEAAGVRGEVSMDMMQLRPLLLAW